LKIDSAILHTSTFFICRVPNLNLGVECTINLLQSILRDEINKENPERSISENELISLYSTAIIRFINLTSHLGQVVVQHQPISVIAKKAGIPEWIVSIRHEATHAKMPSLAMFRMGAKYALEWLETNYWRLEDENSYPLYWPESKRGAAKILRSTRKEDSKSSARLALQTRPLVSAELHHAVSMFIILLKEMANNQTLDRMKCQELHEYICSIWERKLNKVLSEKERKQLQIPSLKVRYEIMTEIERCVLKSSKDDVVKRDVFISAVLNATELPTERGGKYSDFYSLWKLVQKWANLPFLLEKLGEKAIEDESKRITILKLISDLCQALIHNRSNPGDSKFLRFDKMIQSYDWTNLIETLLQEPNQETLDPVSKLCEMQYPDDETMKDNIASVLKMYLDSAEEQPAAGAAAAAAAKIPASPATSRIYGRDMVAQPASKKQKRSPANEETVVASPKTIEVVDTWTLATDYNWSEITIGSVPGAGDIDDLDILEAEWTRLEPVKKTEFDFSVAKKRTTERFDWNSLAKQRRKRGGLPKTTVSI